MVKLMLSPILLFVYNRPEHTQKTINALKKNILAEESKLFIFSDGAKNLKDEQNVKEVRNIINAIDGFKKIEIFESRTNKGLANSIIDGVTKIINEYTKVIVLEDDLITSKNFLRYMNRALDFYEENKKIWSISGYNLPIDIPNDYKYDVYLAYRAASWGWATWKDRWDKIDWEIKDFDQFTNDKSKQKKFNRGGIDMTRMLKNQMNGKIDSWAIRWCYNQFAEDSYTIYPVKSKVQNIGMDGSGVHCGASDKHEVSLDLGDYKVEFVNNLELNKNILHNFKKHYAPNTFKGKIGLLLRKIGLYKIAKRLLSRCE
jgi:hypothetical protein